MTHGLAKKYVLAAGSGIHRRELSVGERAKDRYHPRDDPRHQQPERRIYGPRDVSGDDEDARADHRTGDEHRRVGQRQRLDELARRWSGVGRGCRGCQKLAGASFTGFDSSSLAGERYARRGAFSSQLRQHCGQRQPNGMRVPGSWLPAPVTLDDEGVADNRVEQGDIDVVHRAPNT